MKSLCACVAFLIVPAALFAEGGMLWLSCGEKVKERDGSATIPLEIKFGSYPDCADGLSQLEGLRVFSIIKGKKGADVIAPLQIEEKEGRRIVKATAVKPSSITVLAEARSGQCVYSAETSFSLFGRSLSSPKERPRADAAPSRRLALSLEPRFDYWPQVGSPLALKCLFDNEPLSSKTLLAHDGARPCVEFKGIYTPPEDRELSWRGETAFKEIVFEAQESRDGTLHISTFTRILHRSRTAGLKVAPGVAVFAGSLVASVLLLSMLRRRRPRS